MTNLMTSISYFSTIRTLPRRLVLSFTQGTDDHLKCFGGMGNELISTLQSVDGVILCGDEFKGEKMSL